MIKSRTNARTESSSQPSQQIPPDISKVKGLELILSILLAISLAQSLNLFVGLPTTETWFLSSFIIIGLTITVVYMVLGLKIQNWYRDLTMIISIGFFMFFPFAFQRTNMELESQALLEWTVGTLFIYLALMAIPIFLWAHAEYLIQRNINEQSSKSTVLTLIGVVLMIIGLLGWAYLR